MTLWIGIKDFLFLLTGVWGAINSTAVLANKQLCFYIVPPYSFTKYGKSSKEQFLFMICRISCIK